MPPVRITNVMPIARIADIATCFARIERLFAVKKEGAKIEKRTSKASRTRRARARSINNRARADTANLLVVLWGSAAVVVVMRVQLLSVHWRPKPGG